jgi:SulP family sulfate permease
MLPSARRARRAVVILRLRGRTNLGSTVFNVVERYAAQLHRGGGKLVLSGVSDPLYSQIERTGLLTALGSDNVIRAIVRPGAAMRRAVAEAEAWLGTSDPKSGDESRNH